MLKILSIRRETPLDLSCEKEIPVDRVLPVRIAPSRIRKPLPSFLREEPFRPFLSSKRSLLVGRSLVPFS